MTNPKSLTAEENERVIAAVRELLQQHGGSQSKLAPVLRIKQPTLSAMLGGKHQAGWPLARRVAELMGVTPERLVGHVPETRVEYDAGHGLDAVSLGRHRDFERVRRQCETEPRYQRRLAGYPGILDRVARIAESSTPEFLTADTLLAWAEALIRADEEDERVRAERKAAPAIFERVAIEREINGDAERVAQLRREMPNASEDDLAAIVSREASARRKTTAKKGTKK
jgi:transcriptional regulator with XRE-family HTH domain